MGGDPGDSVGSRDLPGAKPGRGGALAQSAVARALERGPGAAPVGTTVLEQAAGRLAAESARRSSSVGPAPTTRLRAGAGRDAPSAIDLSPIAASCPASPVAEACLTRIPRATSRPIPGATGGGRSRGASTSGARQSAASSRWRRFWGRGGALPRQPVRGSRPHQRSPPLFRPRGAAAGHLC